MPFADERPWPAANPFAPLVPVRETDTRTNSRIKEYRSSSVLQVANIQLFSKGDYEPIDGKPKRPWYVPPKGKASDPERSEQESRRRAVNHVRDIALCNQFDYMFTWTLDGQLIDRYDADEIYKKVRGFLTNATQRKDFRYVLVPEYHSQKEGESRPAIHFHGLCQLGDVKITPALKKNGSQRFTKRGQPIFNMQDWRYGFSTCVQLDENYERAANYVVKYITKTDQKIFGKWYLSSRLLTKKPRIIPLEDIDFDQFVDKKKLQSGKQKISNVFGSVMIANETINKPGQ